MDWCSTNTWASCNWLFCSKDDACIFNHFVDILRLSRVKDSQLLNPFMFDKLILTFLVLISTVALADDGICTREYAPVCGQLSHQTQTFSNRCMMKDAGASWVSDGECPSQQNSGLAKDITLTVAAHDVACMGVAPMRCLQVKEGKALKWSNFYSPIEGFTFTPGVQYKLLVRATPMANAPADAGDTRYELVRVLWRKPAQ